MAKKLYLATVEYQIFVVVDDDNLHEFEEDADYFMRHQVCGNEQPTVDLREINQADVNLSSFQEWKGAYPYMFEIPDSDKLHGKTVEEIFKELNS